MADKEKRILLVEVSPDCKALKFDCDPFDDGDGMFCDKNGQWVSITEKDCKKCKSPVLAGITRAEAVEIMAKAMFYAFNPYDNWDAFKKVFSNNGFVKDAEAALDALLCKDVKNEIQKETSSN